MKKLLLIIPPITEKIWSNHYHEIYLGLAYLANVAKKYEYKVNVLDCDAEFITYNSLKRKIINYGPDMIGLTALYGSITNAMKIADLSKRVSKAKVILGGLPASFSTDLIASLCKSIDIFVRGEGEKTFSEILANRPLESIKGISYKVNNSIIHNPDQIFIEDLDALGIPNRSLFPLHKYKIRFKKDNSTAIETTRGCPYACDFCTQKPKEGRKLRYRSPKIVIDELTDISKYKKIRRVMIVDNDFLTNPRHASEILKQIIENKFDKRFHFMFATRVQNLQKGGKPLLSLIKKANVNTIFFGIESVSDKHRDSIGKIKDLSSTEKLFSKLEKLDIDPMPSYVIGYPDENRKDIQKTFNFATRLNSKIFSFNILTPYPCTPLFLEFKKKKLLKNFKLNNLDNAHQVFNHKLDLSEEFKKIHRNYIFRTKYLSKIDLLQIYKRRNSGRVAMFLYYIVFFELSTYIRSFRRVFKRTLLKNYFET